MIVTIDTATDALLYDQITQLDGVEYLLRFQWSTRESAWYLGIYDQDESPIAVGIRLVVDWPLLRRFQDPRLPPGLLFCSDTSGRGREIEQSSDLGERVQLVYVTADDETLAA